MIRLNIPEVCLLHHLPDELSIGQADPQNEITISLQGQYIYTTTLYANNGECKLYDFRTLLHDNMRQRGLVIAKLEIYFATNNGMEVFDDHYIVFSDTYTPYEDDDEFFEKCFLTTRTYYTYPRNRGSLGLWFLMMPGHGESLVYDCVFRRDDGSTYSHRMEYSTFPAPVNEPVVKQFYISLSGINMMAGNSLGSNYGTLIAFTVNVGMRSVAVYLTDEKPAEVFVFRNIFNVYETACIFGKKTTKTEFSAKEARCGGRNLQYDLSRTQKFEIETRALPIEEAEWLTQLFEGCFAGVSPSFYDSEWVVFSDITSEISNSAKDQVRIKFTYKYESNMLWMKERSESSRFTSQFTQPFD